jgi:hypothetical protein
LLVLVKSNPNLRILSFEGNRIEASLRLKIKAALEENTRGARSA